MAPAANAPSIILKSEITNAEIFMKTLLILRHAKAEPAREHQSDHDRRLASRGLRDAVRIGEWLCDNELAPERIYSSTAVRARQTADLVAATCDLRGHVELCDDLYLGPPGAYLDRARQAADGSRRIMFVGHNPILEHLVDVLTGRQATLSTANLAIVEAPVSLWQDLSFSQEYKLVEVVDPHDA
jgi:phosphohistidine phosphatase